MTQIEINLNIINLRSLNATLKIMYMTALKKDKEGDYTKLLKSSLNDVQESIKCMVELEKVIRSNETLISSYQISMMRMENQVKELKQENKNLIDLF
jgi:hypothetical protein